MGHNKGRQAAGAIDSDSDSENIRKDSIRRSSHRFQPGQSGNPAGKPKGTRNKNGVLLESILKESGEALVNKLADMALKGNTACLKMALSRLYPAPQVAKIKLDDMPELNTLSDIPEYLKALMKKLGNGEIDVFQFDALSRSLHRMTDSMERAELEQRITELESKLTA